MAEWAQNPHFMSVKDVLYIYTDYREETDPEAGQITLIPAIKIGDGMAYVVDLPFATLAITPEDIARWDAGSGLNAEVDEETHTLIFYLT